MYINYKTSRTICPHCYMATEVPIEVCGKKCILDEYTCQRCGKKFTLLEASKHDICQTSQQICPHCYRENEVLIDGGDGEYVLGSYTCKHCQKTFTLLEAAEAKVSKNTGVYPGQDPTSPFYLKDAPPNSEEAKSHKLIVGILLCGIPIIFRLAEKFAMKGPFSKFSQAAYDFLANLFLKVLMRSDVNTSSLEAFARLGIFLAFFLFIFSVIAKIFKLDRKIVIKFKQ
ncbi:MAG: hypothetical protein Q4F00_12665 [bacterium]|nr:hypothetical protein [bacterium]